MHEIEQELAKMQAQYSSKPKVCITAPFNPLTFTIPGASSRSSSKRSSRRSSKGSSRSSHKKRSSSSTESDGEAPPRPPPPSRPKHSGKSDSDGSGYTRLLNDAKKPDDTSDDEGPGRPPLPKDDSSVDGYHSTKSTESDSETTTHEVITEQKVEHEYFVDGAPIRRSPISSTSSMEEVPPASIQSIHSSSSLSSSSSSDSVSWCATLSTGYLPPFPRHDFILSASDVSLLLLALGSHHSLFFLSVQKTHLSLKFLHVLEFRKYKSCLSYGLHVQCLPVISKSASACDLTEIYSFLFS